MADDKSLKSAYELAMERFRKSDAEAGVEPKLLTDEQKAAIAEIRNFYKAKGAEQEVLHESGQRKTMEPAEREALDREYRRERERLASEQDAKIEKIRSGRTT
jgi:hypothetical protein